LPHASCGGRSQTILGKSAPQRKHRAVLQRCRRAVIFNCREDRLFRGFRHQSDGYRVVQDQGPVEELVSRPRYRWPQHRSAWLSRQHIDIASPRASIGPDVRELDHLAPLLGFLDDEFTEIGR
jgi:hypothetical protein